MTVYVDDMAVSFTPTHVQGRRYVMCHMMADTDEELLAMADKIGLNRKWIQRVPSGTHFDIAKSKKALAIKHGAVEITQREMAAYAWHRRTLGFAACPAIALEKMRATHRASAAERSGPQPHASGGRLDEGESPEAMQK